MFIEGNEARSVMETLSGLLGAMRVWFRDDRLSFAQTVAPYFAGYDAFRWSRRVMLVETSCRSRHIMLWRASRHASATAPFGASGALAVKCQDVVYIRG